MMAKNQQTNGILPYQPAKNVKFDPIFWNLPSTRYEFVLPSCKIHLKMHRNNHYPNQYVSQEKSDVVSISK
jgi:hypothetical protein